MLPIRVLIIDDSVVIRKLLSDTLSADPEIEVVGTAANGRIGLARIEQFNPDVVTLDIEMPEMDGLATLRAIRQTHPRLPVIMFSTLTQRGAEATLDALSLGASDYVTKPANVGSVQAGMDRIREELGPKIKALGHKCHGASPQRPEAAPPTLPRGLSAGTSATQKMAAPIEIVVIGLSTGGPNALAEFFPHLPGDFPVPIVVVQHMPPVFTKYLAERLDSKCALEVREAVDGDILAPGRAWIAPGDFHIVLERGALQTRLRTQQGPPENSCRPAVDVLFRSASEVFGPRVLGVVMTGMGQDGLRGCACIADAGGVVYVQDEGTSVVWGMPGQVAAHGLADQVLPLADLSVAVRQRVSRQTVQKG